MSDGEEVTIVGRRFTIGVIYAPRPDVPGSGRYPPRRLLHHTADSMLPGGKVTVAMVPSGRKRVVAGTEWAAWAGEEVGPG